MISYPCLHNLYVTLRERVGAVIVAGLGGASVLSIDLGE